MDENSEEVYKLVRKRWQTNMRVGNNSENPATKRCETWWSKENQEYEEAIGRRSWANDPIAVVYEIEDQNLGW